MLYIIVTQYCNMRQKHYFGSESFAFDGCLLKNLPRYLDHMAVDFHHRNHLWPISTRFTIEYNGRERLCTFTLNKNHFTLSIQHCGVKLGLIQLDSLSKSPRMINWCIVELCIPVNLDKDLKVPFERLGHDVTFLCNNSEFFFGRPYLPIYFIFKLFTWSTRSSNVLLSIECQTV